MMIENAASRSTDINVLMRQGHVYVADVERLYLELVEHHCRRRARPVRVLEVGCASGITSQRLAELLPNAMITAQEEYAPFAELARERLAGTEVELHTGPIEALSGPFDVILSGGAHHHLPSNYLGHMRALLKDDGVFVLADEFCPEYCTPEQRAHIAAAPLIHLANGYVLTSAAETEEYAKFRQLPARARQMEASRRRSLWHWYRYVIDEAMRGDHVEVAIAELQSAHDDLITGEAMEHKLAPSILERQLALAGFRVVHKHVLGPVDDPSLHSIMAYEIEIAQR
jgi:2-polyprenyl-3-methyl-5-hydroxy-6-metoxy-1,4-benzoquinol methylase